MLRVLACMPHFFRRGAADSGMAHGSNSDTLESRSEQFRYCLMQLTAVLEPDRFLMGSPGRIAHEQVEPMPQSIAGEIMVVTVPENNLISEISAPPSLNASIWSGHPRLLGYGCRRVFAHHVGQYDFYLFIEDDTTILDPSFFRKIAAFYRAHGEDRILLPNRFEIFGPSHHGWRAYLDQPAFPRPAEPRLSGGSSCSQPAFGPGSAKQQAARLHQSSFAGAICSHARKSEPSAPSRLTFPLRFCAECWTRRP